MTYQIPHDKCCVCGRPIENGIQYITNTRTIRHGNKPWFASDGGHYSFCDECRQRMKAELERMRKEWTSISQS